MRLKLLLAALALAGLLRAELVEKWNRPMEPYKIVGNIYYVGTNYLASYLVTTPAGDILINPNYEQSVPLIRESVEKLGFRMSDIKIILISHAHDDHAAGCALAKRLSGARLMVMDADVPVIEGGGKGDFAYTARWAPAKVDKVLHDGEQVRLGEMVLTAHLTPGHTKGCTTWTMEVKDGGRTLQVVIVGSANVNSGYKLVSNAKYPQIAADYEKTFRVLASLPCDIFLGAHGVYFGMDEKVKRMRSGAANPFEDAAGYRAYVAEREQAFREELARQKAQSHN